MTGPPTAIWVSDYVDYPPQGGIDGFYTSEEAAVRNIKERYGSPYRVEWSETRQVDGSLLLSGDFESVVGYSTKHVGKWEIRKEEVQS